MWAALRNVPGSLQTDLRLFLMGQLLGCSEKTRFSWVPFCWKHPNLPTFWFYWWDGPYECIWEESYLLEVSELERGSMRQSRVTHCNTGLWRETVESDFQDVCKSTHVVSSLGAWLCGLVAWFFRKHFGLRHAGGMCRVQHRQAEVGLGRRSFVGWGGTWDAKATPFSSALGHQFCSFVNRKISESSELSVHKGKIDWPVLTQIRIGKRNGPMAIMGLVGCPLPSQSAGGADVSLPNQPWQTLVYSEWAHRFVLGFVLRGNWGGLF